MLGHVCLRLIMDWQAKVAAREPRTDEVGKIDDTWQILSTHFHAAASSGELALRLGCAGR